MAYGSSTTISYLGTLAAGAMADGQGFATEHRILLQELTKQQTVIYKQQ